MADDRVDLRLYNTIIVFDVYTVARSAGAAREAVIAALREGAQASEEVAQEVTNERSIRASWVDQTPYVAADVTEEEFSGLQGVKTLEAYRRLYKRG